MASAATPMMAQWHHLKEQAPDALLLFRLGDFYELFGADAQEAAPVLDLVLTARDGVPMCGVPHHALESYAARLLARGFRVAVAEQTEDPALARGLVRRDLVRILTPGTVVEEGCLDEGAPSWCCALAGEDGGAVDLAVADASTGEFRVARLTGWAAAWEEMGRLRPREVLLPDGLAGAGAPDEAALGDALGCAVTRRPFAAGAREALLAYLREVQRGEAPQVTAVEPYDPAAFLQIDAAAQRNLELLRRLSDGAARGSLLAVLDHTVTAMGARRLRAWLERPLLDVRSIAGRLDAVSELVRRPLFREGVRRALRAVRDVERLAGRVATGRVGPRDLAALGASLRAIPGALQALGEPAAPLLRDVVGRADPVEELAALLERALVEQPPAAASDGGAIREGYSAELDDLRAAAEEGRGWLGGLEARERERTGLRSLKVGYNRVFGYYIEVSRAGSQRVPEDYQRRQTLAGSERYVTPELKDLESRILGATERAARIEEALVAELREAAARHIARLQATARAVGELDALASLAEAAARGGWVRPAVDSSLQLRIRGGRHPVLEQTLGPGRFVPNDLDVDADRRFLLLTGPNMAGKSTYMRQAALLVVLAQTGSFVPAAEARIGIVDRIFTRVGASDDLAGGRSTFMVEMTEVAQLLAQASPRSLLLLDEVGRGTGTLDGLAIAWAVAEEVARHLRARTIFATHFHELTAVADGLPGAANLHVAVQERGPGVVFLHRIVPGASDRSYGIHVARLAGVPEPVAQRAETLLGRLESQGGMAAALGGAAGLDEAAAGTAPGDGGPAAGRPRPLPALDGRGRDLLDRLARLDVDRLTPLEALNLLFGLRADASGAVAEGGDAG